MLWDKIIGHETVKNQLKESIQEGRISHAQLFAGPEGSGALQLAIAYAQAILCGKDNGNCQLKVANLQHPDLHFSYPTATTDTVKDKAVSKLFTKEWRAFLSENPYGNIFDWMHFLGVEKKQGIISVHESAEIIKSLSLNSYEGGYKIMIIWLPEKMNNNASNALLKIIEEPPQKTVFLLVTENEGLLLPTIISRCQLIRINRLTDTEITQYLIEHKQIEPSEAKHIAYLSQGNLREAMLQFNEGYSRFDSYFVSWVRNAFLAATNTGALKHLVNWANEISLWPREDQKEYLSYCSEIFRQALMANYQANELVYMEVKTENFNLHKFAPFIHGANIQDILDEINEASYHIERNANAKIVLLDLSIKLTRLLHRKV